MCAKKESVCDDAGLIYADAEPICARGELMTHDGELSAPRPALITRRKKPATGSHVGVRAPERPALRPGHHPGHAARGVSGLTLRENLGQSLHIERHAIRRLRRRG